jgi:hypothetical protein
MPSGQFAAIPVCACVGILEVDVSDGWVDKTIDSGRWLWWFFGGQVGFGVWWGRPLFCRGSLRRPRVLSPPFSGTLRQVKTFNLSSHFAITRCITAAFITTTYPDSCQPGMVTHCEALLHSSFTSASQRSGSQMSNTQLHYIRMYRSCQAHFRYTFRTMSLNIKSLTSAWLRALRKFFVSASQVCGAEQLRQPDLATSTSANIPTKDKGWRLSCY